MAGVELANAWVTITPTTKGIEGQLAKELSPLTGVASKAGADSGHALGSSFTGASGGFKSGVGELKAGFGALGDTVSQKLSGPLGIAAVGGIFEKAGEFAFGAVTKFSTLGVEVGKVADATGLSVDAASRWIEVAGDIGIGPDTLESSIGKMNKTAGNTPQIFEDAGIHISRLKDGTVDANATFLNTIARLKGIKDPAQQAALATKVLGKGWQSMAELIGQGSDKLKASLQSVDEQKVFDEAKVAKAREFRDVMDKLHDSLENFVLDIGSNLAPALDGILGTATSIINKYSDVFGFVGDQVLNIKEKVLETGVAVTGWGDDTQGFTQKQKDLAVQIGLTNAGVDKMANYAWPGVQTSEERAAAAAQAYADQVDKTGREVKSDIADMQAKWDTLFGNLNAEQSLIHLKQQAEDVKTANEDAGKAIKEHGPGSPEAIAAIADARDKQIELEKATALYAKDIAGLPPEVATRIAAEIGAGDIDKAIADVEQGFQNHAFRINAHLDTIKIDGETHAAGSVSDFSNVHIVPTHYSAKGGPAGGPTVINELGPELVRLPNGSWVATAAASRSLMAYSASLMSSADSGPVAAPLIGTLNNNGRDIGIGDLNQVLAMARLRS